MFLRWTITKELNDIKMYCIQYNVFYTYAIRKLNIIWSLFLLNTLANSLILLKHLKRSQLIKKKKPSNSINL